MNIQFYHHLGAVRVSRLDADAQQRSYLFGRVPLADQLQDLSFTNAQLSVGRVGVAQIRTHHRLGDLRTQINLAAFYMPDGGRQIRARLCFE